MGKVSNADAAAGTVTMAPMVAVTRAVTRVSLGLGFA
jgi:hypothetical protein